MKTALEAVLQAMVTEGWANESDGMVDSPTGHFARISNSETEVLGWPGGISTVFAEVIATYEMDDERELIGHFLVQENDQGFVTVTSFTNPVDLTRAYEELQNAFALWDESE